MGAHAPTDQAHKRTFRSSAFWYFRFVKAVKILTFAISKQMNWSSQHLWLWSKRIFSKLLKKQHVFYLPVSFVLMKYKIPIIMLRCCRCCFFSVFLMAIYASAKLLAIFRISRSEDNLKRAYNPPGYPPLLWTTPNKQTNAVTFTLEMENCANSPVGSYSHQQTWNVLRG